MKLSSTRPALARKITPAQILLELHRHGLLSKSQLAQRTGLSVMHVGRIVDDLLHQGDLCVNTMVSGQRGRPVTLFEINPRGAPIAGVLLDPETAQIVIANPCGVIQYRKNLEYVNETDAPSDVLEAVVAAICMGARELGFSVKKLQGVGVAVAGLADPQTGMLDGLTNRSGWENLPVAKILGDALGIPILVDNDVRAGASSAQWRNNQVRDGGIMYIYVGEGIGAAYVQSDLELVRGAHDAAGLIGHMTVQPGGPLCGCGNEGCLEVVASELAFIHGLHPKSLKKGCKMTAQEREQFIIQGFDRVRQGNPDALALLDTITRYLGIGLANAVSMFDPHRVYLFGTLFDGGGQLVMDRVRREALSHIWPKARGVEIRLLPQWKDFLLHGALGLVIWQPFRALRDVLLSPTAHRP